MTAIMEGNLLENDRKRYADDITLQELVRLRVENERLREALKEAHHQLDYWQKMALLKTSEPALQQKESE